MTFLERARIQNLHDQQVITVFPAGFNKEDLLFEIYPEADWSDEPLVFADLDEIEKWGTEFSNRSLV